MNFFSLLGHLYDCSYYHIISTCIMKMKSTIFMFLMMMCLSFQSLSQSLVDGGELPEVTIRCKQSFYSSTIDLGFISWTYSVSKIICDNGFEQETDNFWSF